MKILTKKNSEGKKSARLVGAYVPTDLYEYLSLYNLANSTSKTEVLNTLLQEWFVYSKTSISSEKELIRDIVKFVLVPKWKNTKKSKITLDVFIKQLEGELGKQHLSSKIIDSIIKKFKYATKQK